MAFPAASRLKRWFACTPSTTGLLIPSSLSLATVWSARFYQAEPAPVVGTTKCPESLCRMLALPSSESRVTVSSEDITPRSSLLRTHSSILCSSPLLRLFASLKESLPIATSPGCYQAFPTLFLRICPLMPEPVPRRVPLSAFAWFFLNVFGLPKKENWSASRLFPRTRFSAGLLSRLQLFRYVQGRGRDSGCPLPPAQTRAGAASAHGSYLGCLASKRTLG